METSSKRFWHRRMARLYIKEWFDSKGVSDEKVADKLGVARETVFRWRRELHRLNPEKLGQLAKAIDIAPEDFYRHPDQPSADALLRDQPQEIKDQAMKLIQAIRRTG